MTKVDLTGRQFGRWLAMQRDLDRPGYWQCWCACGQLGTVRGDSLTRGLSKSCGCLRSDAQSANVADKCTAAGCNRRANGALRLCATHWVLSHGDVADDEGD